MAVTPAKFSAATPITVHLGTGKFDNLDIVHKIVASALGKLGCGSCLYGFEIRFSHINELVVNPRTLEVGLSQFGK